MEGISTSEGTFGPTFTGLSIDHPSHPDTAAPANSSTWLKPVSGPPQPTAGQQVGSAPPPIVGLNPGSSWAFNFVPETPAWLAEETFDLDALNTAVMTSANQSLSTEPVNGLVEQQIQPLCRDKSFPVEDVVQREWFTYTGSSRSDLLTPDISSERTQVDETYRANLEAKLQHHVPIYPLPSTDFLVGHSPS
jgi:hypothetical protein